MSSLRTARTARVLVFISLVSERAADMHFEHSAKVQDLQKRLSAFMDEHIYPKESVWQEQIAAGDRWQPVEIVEQLKPKARAAGLWNLFLPDRVHGAGLTN